MRRSFVLRQCAMLLGNQPRLSLALLPLLQWLWPGYRPGFYRARLLSVVQESRGSYSLWLQPPASWPGFVPGQSVELGTELNGRWLTRRFSISSSLQDWQQKGQIRLTMKLNPYGVMTRALPALLGAQSGLSLSISKAEGAFVWAEPTQASLMLAAGSGITPLASMLLSQRCWTAPATLLYYVRERSEAALLAELEQLAASQPFFSVQLVETATQGRCSFASLLPGQKQFTQLLSCGPFGFTEKALQFGAALGLEAGQCQREFFRLPAPAESEKTGNWPVRWHTAEGECQTLGGATEPLLRQAEQSGLQPRFGCRIGVCYQCVCQKESGVVLNLRTGQLSTAGAEQIQLCVSVPQSALSIRLGDA
ncbi:iron-sulfur cluster-binding domain-containing protein [Rheinheimera sp.]|uniref:flavin reductase family protein n=1 Tax=Rheinheimera sp. TaxID=1869214 RepID=UPI00307F429E